MGHYYDWSNYKLDVIVAGDSSVKTSHLGALGTGLEWSGGGGGNYSKHSTLFTFILPLEKKLLQSCQERRGIFSVSAGRDWREPCCSPDSAKQTPIGHTLN